MTRKRTLLVTLLLLVWCQNGIGQNQKYHIYDTDLMKPAVFKARREKVMKEMPEGSIAFFYAGPEQIRNNGVEFQYRQNNNFYYLTGMNEPNCVLALIPGGTSVQDPKDSTKFISVREILFVQPRDPIRERWTGRRLGPQGAMEVLGFEYAMNNDQLRDWIPRLAFTAKIIYIPAFPVNFFGEIEELTKPLRDIIRRLNSRVEFRDPTAMVTRMRAVKSPEEIEMIQKAVDISCEALRQMMMSAEPGMYEYELQAIFEYVSRRRGSEYLAFPCIVGSAENSVILHYNTNRRKLNSGDIVVMDCGAEYHNYAADVTRTIPINGRFSDAQRQIYEIVLRAQDEAIKMMKPGVHFHTEVSGKAIEVIQDGLLKLGIIKTKEEYSKFFIHGVGHPVGLSVHDVAGTGKLEPGMVWTVEPGIYIPEGSPGVDPKYYNIGVRIEDCVLVTEDGYKIMSASAPRTVDEIERLMKKRGIGNEPLD